MQVIGQVVRKLLLVMNLLILFVLILSGYGVPRLAPDVYPLFGFLGLIFPFILLLTILFIVFWLFIDFRYALFGVAAILLCWKFTAVLFAFHFSKDSIEPTSEEMTIMSYNVHNFWNFKKTERTDAELREEILQLIRSQQPDLLCLQEFYDYNEDKKGKTTQDRITEEFNLPYHHIKRYGESDNKRQGVVLFSKYPIIKTKDIPLSDNLKYLNGYYVDIKRGKDTLRVFNMHLQSVHLSTTDMEGLEKIKQREDTELKASKKIVRKLITAFKKRAKHSRAVGAEVRKSNHPTIVCGDFNDPPNSYTYFQIRGDFNDSFLKAGSGLGRTFSKILPTLRIDYIFTSPQFRVQSFQRIPEVLSDHFPIVTRVKL